MKKLLVFLSVVIMSFASCDGKKDDTTPGGNTPVPDVCADCIEANSGYRPPKFCGPLAEVEAYVHELKKLGAQYGQSWSCTIK